MIFFPYLLSQGLEKSQILIAISIGSIVMILGDAVLSYVSDKFSIKITLVVSTVLQVVSMIVLLNCNNFGKLLFFEILMGFSFPGIYEASSKLLKMAQKEKYHEKYNQIFFWTSQFLACLLGSSLLLYPKFVIY